MSTYFLTKLLVIYLLFLCDITITNSKKLRPPNLEGLKSQKMNECGRCKILTDSVNHWLQKTSRGKYEGGDAAWEEAKLKSYARSEIRLVEVQEGLCSELSSHQDDCYMLAEEAEQALETWWFNEDPVSVDLHTWLCIDTLKHCCPMNHFGEFCSPCPVNKDNKICSGHGKCDGEGTRMGTGLCYCTKGFTGDSCSVCAEQYYLKDDSCSLCHKSCDGCNSEGPAGCVACKSGWKLESGLCTDIDECESPSTCKFNEYCVNKEGSYKCKPCDEQCVSCKGSGALNCTACAPDYTLWGTMCITDSFKTDILTITLKRLLLYLGLIVIASIVFRSNRMLASFVIMVISVYIYYAESAISTNAFAVLYNTYLGCFQQVEELS